MSAIKALDAPERRRPRRLVAAIIDHHRGGETGIEPWLERYRREFCVAPPADLDLAALEALAA